MTLGQSAPTLSGGEAQRVKLAAELARPVTGNTLYLLDEPTTGLHFDDIAKLLGVLQRLVELGNTVVVIEHNMDVIKCADWIIDMGPDAGVNGGQIVFAGTPEGLAATAQASPRPRRNDDSELPASITAPFIAQALAASGQNRASKSPRRRRPAATASPPDKPQGAEPSTEAELVLDIPPAASKRSKTTAGVVDPWRALGRRWHSLGKGFPAGATPDWPLELADRMLKLLEKVAGDDCLAFESPDRVEVRPSGAKQAWAQVETKTPESLKITLAGPRDAVDLDQLTALDVDGPVDLSDETRVRVTLNLTEVKHVRSRKLKSFLQSHFERTVRQ